MGEEIPSRRIQQEQEGRIQAETLKVHKMCSLQELLYLHGYTENQTIEYQGKYLIIS